MPGEGAKGRNEGEGEGEGAKGRQEGEELKDSEGACGRQAASSNNHNYVLKQIVVLVGPDSIRNDGDGAISHMAVDRFHG